MSDYETVPTMKVLRNGKEAIINAEDFTSATDKKFGEKAPKAPKPEAPATKPQLGVQRDGDKFFVIDLNTTEKVMLDGIDQDGYDTESEAITAAKEAMK